VELEGTIRPIRTESDDDTTFDLATSLGMVTGELRRVDDREQLRKLIDAKVRVQGVFAAFFTKKGELRGYRILINSLDQKCYGRRHQTREVFRCGRLPASHDFPAKFPSVDDSGCTAQSRHAPNTSCMSRTKAVPSE
jgi:hypothetical protein